MTMQNEPDDITSSEKEAESRGLHRLAHALQCDDMDELAVVLSQSADPAWPAPVSPGPLKQS